MKYLLLSSVFLLIAINIYSLHVSRTGRSVAHNCSFFAGVVGLCSLPLTMLALFMLLPQIITGPGKSPFLTASITILLVSTAASLVSSFVARRIPNMAAA